jgi:hypothetical protein
MRVIYDELERRTIKIGKSHIKVIMAAVQGTSSIPPSTYIEHIQNQGNPHQVKLLQLLVDAGNAGKWLKVNAAGDGIELVDAPLTTMPALPNPIDEKVKADPSDPTAGYLSAKVAGCLVIDSAMHLMRLKGAAASEYPPDYYYGTNDNGVLGFWRLPSALIPSSGIGPENEDEWLNDGAVGFYDYP